MSDFNELRAIVFCRVPKLGPLFEQPPEDAQQGQEQAEGAQEERAQDEGMQGEHDMEASGAMEVETVICD